MTRNDGILRYGIGGIGFVGGVYGVYLFLSRQQEAPQLWSAAKYLIGGVVFNDVLVAAAAVGLGHLVVRVLPRAARAPVVIGGFVLGSITLLAIPVLLSYGRKPDNPTLLDRDFTGGWWVFLAVVVVSVTVGVVVRMRAERQTQAAGVTEPEGDD